MATRMNHELTMANGDEQDVFSRNARRLLGLDQKPGVPKWWKRNYNKRVRSKAKDRIRIDRDGWGRD